MVTTPAPSWTEPGAHPVAAGVHRLPLPLPGDGLRAVNVYAIEDGGSIALVDAGWHREDSWDALTSALRQIGAAVGDVRQVLVTHIHHDHYGQAAALRRASGAVVTLGEGERRSLEAIEARSPSYRDHQRATLTAQGAAALLPRLDALEAVIPRDARLGRALWEPPDRWAGDGTVVELSTRRLVTVATPGHTRGHISFHDEDAGLLFAGDHVLPHITPSLGLEPFSGGLPLVDFVLSLMRVRDLAVRSVLPAHGDVFADLQGRVEALLDHHAARLAACIDIVGTTERTAYEVAQRLAWTRRQRRFDELDVFNQLLAVHESAAHLDLLVVQGTLAESSVDGVHVYRRASTPEAKPG